MNEAVEHAVVDYAIEQSTPGQVRTCNELQKDLDDWMDYYNNQRINQGKMCSG